MIMLYGIEENINCKSFKTFILNNVFIIHTQK